MSTALKQPAITAASVPAGLSSAEAARRLAEFGPNSVVEERIHPLTQIARHFWAPVPWMLEAAIAFIPDPFANHTRMGIRNDPLTRVASSHSFAFRCSDGKLLALHLSSQPKFWEGLLAAIGRPELGNDLRFSTREARIKNYLELTGILAAVFITKPRGEWMALLEREDVPFAPVHNIPDVIEDAQVKHLETFRTLHHPSEGEIVTIRRPVCIDGGRDATDLAAPTLGQHTDEVLSELGYDASGIAKLRKASVI